MQNFVELAVAFAAAFMAVWVKISSDRKTARNGAAVSGLEQEQKALLLSLRQARQDLAQAYKRIDRLDSVLNEVRKEMRVVSVHRDLLMRQVIELGHMPIPEITARRLMQGNSIEDLMAKGKVNVVVDSALTDDNDPANATFGE